VPLKIAYEDLFKLARDPNAMVTENVGKRMNGFVDFKRSLSLQDVERWSELKGELDSITLDFDQNDIVSWGA
jgi:hypothetical protein